MRHPTWACGPTGRCASTSAQPIKSLNVARVTSLGHQTPVGHFIAAAGDANCPGEGTSCLQAYQEASEPFSGPHRQLTACDLIHDACPAVSESVVQPFSQRPLGTSRPRALCRPRTIKQAYGSPDVVKRSHTRLFLRPSERTPTATPLNRLRQWSPGGCTADQGLSEEQNEVHLLCRRHAHDGR